MFKQKCIIVDDDELDRLLIQSFVKRFDLFELEAVFNDAEVIVISPGLAKAEPLVQAAIKRGVPVVGDVGANAVAPLPGGAGGVCRTV